MTVTTTIEPLNPCKKALFNRKYLEAISLTFSSSPPQPPMGNRGPGSLAKVPKSNQYGSDRHRCGREAGRRRCPPYASASQLQMVFSTVGPEGECEDCVLRRGRWSISQPGWKVTSVRCVIVIVIRESMVQEMRARSITVEIILVQWWVIYWEFSMSRSFRCSSRDCRRKLMRNTFGIPLS